jgi:hypothetical protein
MEFKNLITLAVIIIYGPISNGRVFDRIPVKIIRGIAEIWSRAGVI